ncbi:amidohydrolase family protein [uncultured Jatrophihabitans sp.]|uniref:amidohydrolase family protein n=1 Tax=uncultured Jatrophihabitans sp. TaxID=1610747 RepID=UPI0035CADBA6
MRPPLLLRNVSVEGVDRTDVLVRGGRVAGIGPAAHTSGARELDLAGGAVLPGLHDHHCHVLAMAAARDSVACGPPEVGTATAFAAALRRAVPRRGWVRAVGFHESVAGELDRQVLDRIRCDVPVRVQHRSGALWVLNSSALRQVGLDRPVPGEPQGVERDSDGVATGRLWRCDAWLRQRVGPGPAPDVSAVSEELSSYGITGITDATPELDDSAVTLLRSSALRQRAVLLGDPASDAPRKIVVSDHALPSPAELVALIERARPRPVAVHCVTRVALVLTLAALTELGTVPGDRIEHAAVVPPELRQVLARLALTVVTQPSLPALRGDRYLDDVDAVDREHLWPFASLLAAGVPVGCSSDAPYGSPDPWFAVASAVARRSASGRAVAPAERVAARTALRGYLTDPSDPGGAPRRVAVGAAADLVLLDGGLDDVLDDPHAGHVRYCVIDGEVVHAR